MADNKPRPPTKEPDPRAPKPKLPHQPGPGGQGTTGGNADRKKKPPLPTKSA